MNTIENQTEETVIVQETLPKQDLMESLMEQAKQRLEAIGSVGMEHILEAFRDRDEKGRRMTSVEIREDHWDVGEGGILFGRQKAFSMAIEVQLEKSGGYTTVILQFDDPASSDMERFWTVFTDYGKSEVKREGFDLEVPVITLTAVPLTLGEVMGWSPLTPSIIPFSLRALLKRFAARSGFYICRSP